MSKEQEALNTIYDKYVTDDEFLEDDKLFSTVEKALRALEIIKAKYVLVGDMIDSWESFDFNYYHYSKYNDNYSYEPLTEEEFNLLKEVLL